jgi:hypothetical protein
MTAIAEFAGVGECTEELVRYQHIVVFDVIRSSSWHREDPIPRDTPQTGFPHRLTASAEKIHL